MKKLAELLFGSIPHGVYCHDYESKKTVLLKKVKSVSGKASAVDSTESHSHASETVKFGSVTVVVSSPSAVEIERNIKAGQAALRRAGNQFLTPGVRISSSKGVPLFSVDPKTPSMLIRKLNGKKERGVLNNGRFEVCR